jgi:hypothetical protein
MDNTSPLMHTNLLVRVDGRQVSLATVCRYQGLMGRVVWSAIALIHRPLAPGLLRDADRRLRI